MAPHLQSTPELRCELLCRCRRVGVGIRRGLEVAEAFEQRLVEGVKFEDVALKFEDEGFNKTLKRCLRLCHQRNFEAMAFHKVAMAMKRTP